MIGMLKVQSVGCTATLPLILVLQAVQLQWQSPEALVIFFRQFCQLRYVSRFLRGARFVCIFVPEWLFEETLTEYYQNKNETDPGGWNVA
jgi:hypothetical protein